jgi:hypothetical protein
VRATGSAESAVLTALLLVAPNGCLKIARSRIANGTNTGDAVRIALIALRVLKHKEDRL